MGDISELRGLVVMVSFMGLFVFLAILIPVEFMTVSPQKETEFPEYFEAVDVQFYADTENFTIDSDYYQHDFTMGGWNLCFQSVKAFEIISSSTYASWWIFKWGYTPFKWYDEHGLSYGDQLDFEDLDSLWVEQGQKENQTIKFTIKTDQTQLTVFFGWNTTEYSKPSDAIKGYGMEVLYAVSMDQVNTSLNAWTLVGMLLVFQLPDVHWIINTLIAIPCWTVIAYLIYVLIIKVIPLIAGG